MMSCITCNWFCTSEESMMPAVGLAAMSSTTAR